MCNDLLKLIRISRNASLNEITAKVQQIEDILYRRVKDEPLSNKLEQLSLHKTETLPNRRYKEGYSRKTTPGLSNKYSLNKNVAISGHYLNNKIQRTVDDNTCQQLNSYRCYL